MFGDILPPLIDMAAAGALFYAAWRVKSSGGPLARKLALAWLVLGIAEACTGIADTLWMVFDLVLHTQPSPSAADVFYLLYYGFFLAGVLLLPAVKKEGFDWLKTFLDILILLLSAFLFALTFIIGPVLASGAPDTLTLAVGLAYPTGDMMLIGALLMILYRPARSVAGLTVLLLAASVAVMIIFDLIYLYLSIEGLYQAGAWIDLGYSLSNLLMGLAGVSQVWWMGQARVMSQAHPAPEPDRRPARVISLAGNWLLCTPYAVVVAAYIMQVARPASSEALSVGWIPATVGLMIGLVLLRQMLVLQENRVLSRTLKSALDEVQRQSCSLESTNRDLEVEILERRRVEERLSFDAMHDGLTGLPNRALLLDRLRQAGRRKKRTPDFEYAVLFLDLDSFKVVNDSLGHVTGDRLLARTGEILQGCIRATDTVARLGGDEFVILLDEVRAPEDVISTANRLQKALSQPIHFDGMRVFITVSIGIVQNVDGYEQPEDVLRDADLAMYQAKTHGKARYEIFHTGMRASVLRRLELESDLRRALDNQEFILYYQPILELPGQRLVGFEALARWNHPARGIISPAEFIPVAEETGMILPLGRWILKEACRQAEEWRQKLPRPLLPGQMLPGQHLPGVPGLKINVNISGIQLKQPGFVELVAETLAETGLPACHLALEVTELVCLDSLDLVANTLEELRALGVETEIDDFGTGYSSLSYLQRLPVRSIKIDRSFIREISDASGGDTPDIVRAIFSMVEHLGIRAVAEGIENEAQLEAMGRMHCAFVQGYLLAHAHGERSGG